MPDRVAPLLALAEQVEQLNTSTEQVCEAVDRIRVRSGVIILMLAVGMLLLVGLGGQAIFDVHEQHARDHLGHDNHNALVILQCAVTPRDVAARDEHLCAGVAATQTAQTNATRQLVACIENRVDVDLRHLPVLKGCP